MNIRIPITPTKPHQLISENLGFIRIIVQNLLDQISNTVEELAEINTLNELLWN